MNDPNDVDGSTWGRKRVMDVDLSGRSGELRSSAGPLVLCNGTSKECCLMWSKAGDGFGELCQVNYPNDIDRRKGAF